MSKEEIIEEICSSFEVGKKKLIYCWNIIFQEEKISSDVKISKEVKDEMIENIQEELEYSDDYELISKVYRKCTGSSIEIEDIYSEEDLQFEDEDLM